MKRFLAIVAIAVASTSALATSVGVPIAVGEPGYHGRIDIVNLPPPQLLFSEPIIIEPVPAGVVRQPVYVYVPYSEAKQWRKYCKKYKVRGQPAALPADPVPRQHRPSNPHGYVFLDTPLQGAARRGLAGVGAAGSLGGLGR